MTATTAAPPSSPTRTILRAARSVILWLAAAVGAACIVLTVLALAFGVRSQIVVSGSMEPFMPTGSLILVKDTPAAELEVRDVVTVPRPHGEGLVTHRIIATETPGSEAAATARALTLQGDANQSPDPRPYTVASAGKVLFVIPQAGTLFGQLRTPMGIGGIVVVSVAVLACYGLAPRRGKR
jgi:signal peptidase I